MTAFNNDVFGILNSILYSEVFEKKGVKFLRIRKTKDFSDMREIDIEIRGEHVWSQGDSLYKLSNKFYGEYDFWWCIAITNAKPTDAHYKIGDIVNIPARPAIIQEALD
jgi:hypothetical protein